MVQFSEFTAKIAHVINESRNPSGNYYTVQTSFTKGNTAVRIHLLMSYSEVRISIGRIIQTEKTFYTSILHKETNNQGKKNIYIY